MSILLKNRKREEICRLFSKRAVGAEIGVFCGEFARLLAKAAEPSCLYLIDPWWEVQGEVYSNRSDHMKTRDAHQRTLDRMKWWLEKGIARVLVQRSQEALAAMPDESLDWAYLDASHDYAQTREELALLARKVKRSGIIAGHDFNTRRHRGVFLAIVDFLEDNPQYEIVYIDNFDQWAIQAAA